MAQHFRVLVIPYRRIYAVSKRNIDEFDRGDSTDTNQKVGQELEVGLGYGVYFIYFWSFSLSNVQS